MKFVHHASQGLQTLIDSDLASWILISAVSASSLIAALLLLSALPYFPS